MRTNIPPIREPFFEAYVEFPNQNPNLPPIRLPIKFNGTTRPWSEWVNNLARQSNEGAEAELAEDLFSGISPEPPRLEQSEADLFGAPSSPAQQPSEQDLFGNVSSVVVQPSSEADLFGSPQLGTTPGPGESDLFGSPSQPRASSSLTRHFLFMGA